LTGGHNIGRTVKVPAPVGEPPVFIRDCDVMHRFVAMLRDKGIITTKMRKKSRIKRGWLTWK
jgi:hypothetical protein